MMKHNQENPEEQKDEAIEETTDDTTSVAADTAGEADATDEADTAHEDMPSDPTSQVPAPKSKKKGRFSALLKSRKMRFGAVSTAITVVVVAVVILLNVIVNIVAGKYPLTSDLTSKQTYSLGETSLSIAKAVKKPVNVIVFYDENAFTNPNTGSDDLNVVMRQFHTMAHEYTTRTNGLVTVEYINMDTNPNAVNTYSKYNVSSGSILFRCGDSYKVSSVDSLYTSETNYSTYSVNVTTEVENVLAVNINSVCNGNNIVVTFATGHGDEAAKAQDALEKLYTNNGYTVEKVDLSTSSTIDPKSTMLVTVGPKTDFSATELQRVRDYLQNDGKHGRNFMVFCNYTGKCPNLYEFLKQEYGIEVTNEYIQETNSENIPTSSVYGALPYIPITTVAENDLTPKYTGSKITFGFCVRLKTNGKTDSENYTVTNHNMVTFPETAQLVPIPTDEKETTPHNAASGEYPLTGMAYAYTYDYDSNGDSDSQKVEDYVLVSGSYDFINDYVSDSCNEDFLVAAINKVCHYESSVNISGTAMTTSGLSFSSQSAPLIGIGLFTVGIPLAVLIVCLVVFLRRKNL